MLLRTPNVFLLVLMVMLASCGAGGSATSQPTPSQASVTSGNSVTWMINRSALDRLQAAGWPETTLKQFFDNTHTYVIGQMPTGWQSISTLSFTSYGDLKKAFAANTIPASVQAILYDNEAWTFTPLEEQLHFSTFIKDVADLVHSHQKFLIATPAADLVRVLDPHGEGDTYTRFLSLNIIKDAAQYADLVEIQAQGSEASTQKYAQFVHLASLQAKASHSRIVVLAGLSTNPSGQKMTGQQLLDAFHATRSDVSGYWLNIPGSQGGYCPRCGLPQPQVAIDFLQRIS
ncbi:MAG TPA: hypothetical protein VKR06_01580 [Ktedonosporobacter sp.]|nr:hypothetical protein [Ktedonosporobacter sp.]